MSRKLLILLLAFLTTSSLYAAESLTNVVDAEGISLDSTQPSTCIQRKLAERMALATASFLSNQFVGDNQVELNTGRDIVVLRNETLVNRVHSLHKIIYTKNTVKFAASLEDFEFSIEVHLNTETQASISLGAKSPNLSSSASVEKIIVHNSDTRAGTIVIEKPTVLSMYGNNLIKLPLGVIVSSCEKD